MNKFDEYIERGRQKAGSQKHLAEIMGVKETNMSSMAAGKRPIPASALAKLAQLLGDVTPGQIWEAQQAARAETEEERQLWFPFINRAAAMTTIAAVITGICAMHTPEANAANSQDFAKFDNNKNYRQLFIPQKGRADCR